jgi:hypothetical protein
MTNKDEISETRCELPHQGREGVASQTVPPGYLATSGSKYPNPVYLLLCPGDVAGLRYSWDQNEPSRQEK